MSRGDIMDKTMAEFRKEIFKLRPWYHDFSQLGVQTDFRDYPPNVWQALSNAMRGIAGRKRKEYGILDSGILANQGCKEELLVPFIRQAFEMLPENPRCLELFCADGYYSLLMKQMRPEADIYGVDKDERAISLALTMARVLGYDARVHFIEGDVRNIDAGNGSYDLILCAGGLYHLTDPADFIKWLTPFVKSLLIVQTVVTLETEDPDYFISPAPGWRHGSRFTYAGVRKWLIGNGFSIINEARNELKGNERLCDRGSAYFLCKKL